MQQFNSIVALAVRSIKTDHAIQQRETLIDSAALNDYAAAMTAGSVFPPIVVFHDGATYWLSDGYHRLEAADEAGLKEIQAEVRPGTKRDATLFACGANRDHGLRRTRADIRRAIESLLKDEEWSEWGDRRIAEHVGASHPSVASVRRELECQVVNFTTCGAGPDPADQGDQLVNFTSCDDEPDLAQQGAESQPPKASPTPNKRIGRDGKTRAMPHPKAAPTPTPQPAPVVNKARLAMQAAHGLAAALTTLEPLEIDLLPEDAVTVLSNLRATLARLELRFGMEVQGHA